MKIQKSISIAPENPETKLTQQKQQLRDAAEMYETYFLNHMVKAMRSTVDRENSMVQPNFAEKVFSEKLDSEYVDGWAKKGGIGLADLIYDHISQRIEAATSKRVFPKGGALPIAPKQGPMPLPATESIRFKEIPTEKSDTSAEYRFEVIDPSLSSGFEAQAPLPGQVVARASLADGWKSVKLDHGQGLRSELTFPGSLPEMGAAGELQAGQRLGILDPARPVLAWKLEWS